MKVLHVYKTYLPDNFEGVARVIWEIAEGTAPLGVESRVLSLSRRPDPEIVPVGQHFSHRAKETLRLASTGLSVGAFAQFRGLSAWADVVHYHFPWPLMDLMQLTSMHKKPSVLTYHSDIVRQKVIEEASCTGRSCGYFWEASTGSSLHHLLMPPPVRC